MLIDVSYDEFLMLGEYRKKKYDKERPNHTYDFPCKHCMYDSDGDYCDIGCGYGVNSHCYARIGKECKQYNEK